MLQSHLPIGFVSLKWKLPPLASPRLLVSVVGLAIIGPMDKTNRLVETVNQETFFGAFWRPEKIFLMLLERRFAPLLATGLFWKK